VISRYKSTMSTTTHCKSCLSLLRRSTSQHINVITLPRSQALLPLISISRVVPYGDVQGHSPMLPDHLSLSSQPRKTRTQALFYAMSKRTLLRLPRRTNALRSLLPKVQASSSLGSSGRKLLSLPKPISHMVAQRSC
jgi:hypothetical protein